MLIKILFFVCCSFLAGCSIRTSSMIGVNPIEWKSYSASEKSRCIYNYKYILNERTKLIKTNIFDTSSLKIKISGGSIMFPPYFVVWSPYIPVDFFIKNETCTNIKMFSFDKKNVTEMYVCLTKDRLSFDPSNFDLTKKIGTAHIYRHPMWTSGITYKKVNSSGYVKMNNVEINIVNNIYDKNQFINKMERKSFFNKIKNFLNIFLDDKYLYYIINH